MNISQKIAKLLSLIVLLFFLASYSMLNSAAAYSPRQKEAFRYMVDAIKETEANKISIEDFSQKLETFIAQGNDINSRYKADNESSEGTLLHFAACYGTAEIIVSLLHSGALIDQQDRDEISALAMAAYFGHIDIVEILLIYRAQIDIVNKKGFSPLWVAVAQNHGDIVQLLLDKGAQANLKVKGYPLLHPALSMGNLLLINKLLKGGADLNIHDNYHRTPLNYAQIINNKEAITAIRTELVLRKKELTVKERQKELTTDLLALC